MEEDTPANEANSPANEEDFTSREAADFLGIPERRLHQLRRRGALPAVRLGWRKWQFRASDLMEYVETITPLPSEKPAAGSDEPTDQKPRLSPSMRDIQAAMVALGPPVYDEEPIRPIGEQAPMVRIANAILSLAIDARGSEIHIEPDRSCVRIRLRIDGPLQEVMMMPKHLQTPLMQRYKVMANIDLINKRSVQSGFIHAKHNNQDYQLRVSVVPSYWGESMVIHVLAQGNGIIGLNRLGLSLQDQAQLEDLIEHSSGLLLLAGPSGSGLTTTAYNLLNKLNNIERNIFTLEPLPEYKIGGITQVYTGYNSYLMNHRPLDRRETLRTILRQGTDVLFAGDLHDAETAADAVEAAASGVLVLATISAPDAVNALLRLQDYGVSANRIGRTVIGAVGQRLVRRLCENCKTAYSAPAEKVRWFFEESREVPTDTVTLYRSEGCETCKQKGYLGRVGLFEVMTMNHEISELLCLGATLPDLREAAAAIGLFSLRRSGAEKMLEGYATFDEVYRALH